MSIAAILSAKGSEVASIAVDAPLAAAVQLLGTMRIGALLVMDGSEIKGILSERDLIYCLKEHGAEILDWPVDRAMSAPPIVIDPDTDALSALALMTKRRIRHLPVVAPDGELRGIVSIGDLVKHRIERIEAEAEAMRTYIQTA